MNVTQQVLNLVLKLAEKGFFLQNSPNYASSHIQASNKTGNFLLVI
jgi:hypothetical protein